MNRTVDQRLRDIQRILDAATSLVTRRASLIPDLARSTGLSAAGVEHALLHHLETEASPANLHRLIAAAGTAQRVHVILSANVFVAALRALVLARAAAPIVTVRPSSRDPVFAEALVAELSDPQIALASGAVDSQRSVDGEIHVYGRDETIARVRASAPSGVLVRGHGAGIGVACIARDADLDAAAESLADDVVAFDQRGCLSPRIAFVVGGPAQGESFAGKLHAALSARERTIPRGELSPSEHAEARRYAETLRFAGTLHEAQAHMVGTASTLLVPPPGRHLHIVPVPTMDALPGALGPMARSIVCIGLTDPTHAIASLLPQHARISRLGAMQRPPLDGPVDRRPSTT